MKRHWLWAFLLGLIGVWGCGRPTPRNTPRQASAAPARSQRAAVEAFRAERPGPLAPAHFVFPTPEIKKLANGLSIYGVYRKTHVASISLIVRHGASALPAGKSGLSGLTARMLSEGTRKKTSIRLAEAVEGLGTTLLTDAGRDESSVSLTVLPEDVGKALALIAEVVLEPAFPAAEFERVRAEWLDGLRAERQDPQRLATLAAVRSLHGPLLGAPVDGTIGDVQKLSINDLADFHHRAYKPDSAALIVVGNVDPASLLEQATRHFGAWRGSASVWKLNDASPAAPERTRVLLVDRPSAVQSAIAVVQRFPKRAEPGHEVREALIRILGGLFTSRLNSNLREKHGFAYGITAAPVATRRTGTLLALTSVRTDVTGAALSQIVRELELIRDPALGAPIAEEELVRARSDLIFTLGAALEHPNRVAATLAKQFVLDLPAAYHAAYPAKIKAISQSEVSEAARALTPGQLTVVVVGDGQVVRPELAQHGFFVEDAPSTLLE